MPSAVMHFYSGQPMHFYSGVDTSTSPNAKWRLLLLRTVIPINYFPLH
jgi:hypothetical protein